MTGIREKMSLIIAVFLIVCLITAMIFFSFRLARLQPVEIKLEEVNPMAAAGDITIRGAVSRPGTYTSRAGDTLSSLVSAAGISDNADTTRLSVYVPEKGESARPQKVDLNRADAWMLQALPGIGEGRARLIVDYRTKNGPFRSVDDLLKIGGFGKSVVDKVRDYATVED
ncbi:MAG: ComEA family DNA-binding protein [Chloroflexi bacterium]|nr:ComEA family DNA-binding protein [Chloroflexota bacterium]